MKNIAELKKNIKDSSLKVRNLKNQRKTVNFKGDRTVEPYQAVLLLNQERFSLRLMHIAYGLLRGRSYEQIEKNVRDENKLTEVDFFTINKLVEKYKPIDIKKEEITSNE